MNRIHTFSIPFLTITLFILGCSTQSPTRLYQNSTIDALLEGNFNGEVTLAELLKHGDFGLGTFNYLDGEMVVLDGKCYQIRGDGKVTRPSLDTRTPLGIVTPFRPERSISLDTGDYPSLQKQLDRLRANNGHAFAFEIRGTFKTLKTRSVPRQDRPFRRLAEVIKTQSTFEFKNVTGTLVGFWFPESMRHVNVPGYHFHFLTDDHQAGGHVLSLELTKGIARWQSMNRIEIALPIVPPTTQPGAKGHSELDAVEK